MKRSLRTPEELFQIFDEDPGLGVLYYTLAAIDNVTVQADGTGDGVFKVYLAHRMGQFEAFLWVNQTLHKSYVQWIHQADNADRCHELWGPVVKNRSNPDGSELNRDTDAETIVRIAKQYAAIATS
jgi:hypothetical protein